MSKIENNRIYYDPYNEIRCDKFALEKFVKESEEKDKIIADLEAKLAVYEKELNDWKDGTIICMWTDAENKVKDLEHQLAEKEELIMFADRTIKGLVFAKEIDKISFAVEQLEKMRKQFDCEDNYCYGDNNIIICINKKIFNDFIDNQIKQLKEMK